MPIYHPTRTYDRAVGPSRVITIPRPPQAFTQALTASLSFVGNFAKGLLYLRNFSASLFSGWNFATGLVSYWKLDETSGTRIDSFGTNHLTPINTFPAVVAGIQGNAPLFKQATNDNYLSCASNSTLQMSGNTDFTIACWVNLTNLNDQCFVTKDDDAANSRDYTLDYTTAAGQGTRFYIKGGGTYIVNSAGTGLSTGVWGFVVAWYDSSNGQLHLRINDTTTFNSATGATGTDVSASEFRIGAREYAGVEGYANAAIDEVAIWKRLLTPAEITALYNSGAGTTYGSGLATLTRLPKKSVAATLSSTAAIIRKITDAGFTAALSFIGTLTKRITDSGFTATLSRSATLVASKTFVRALTAALSFTGVLSRRTGKALSATLTATTAQTKRIVDSGFAATLSFVGATTKKITDAGFTATLSFVGAFNRTLLILRNLTATLSSTATLTRKIGKNLTATLSWIGNLATTFIAGGGHVFTQAFTATLFGSKVFTDNFNRSDGSLGANWTSPVSAFSGASGAMQIFSNQAGCTVDDVHSYATWAGTFSDNQYSQIKITSIGAWTGVCVRYDSSVTRFYLAFVFAANDYRIYAYWDGAYNGLFFGTTETWVTGDTMRLEISGSVHPITATMYRNGVSVGSWTSGSSAEVKTGGNPGIGMYSPAGLNLRLDDWDGGNLGGGGATLTRRTGKTLGATLSSISAQVKKIVDAGFSGTLSFVGSIRKAIRDAGFTATQSFTGLLTASKSFLKSLTATLSFTASIATVVAHFFTRAFTATLSFTGAIRTRAQKVFAATLSFVTTQTKFLVKKIAATLSFVGDFVKLYIPPGPQTFFKAFTATLAPTAAQTKKIIDSGFTAALSFIGNLAAIKLFLRVFTATLSNAGTLTRSTRKALSAIFSTAASLVKRSTRTLSGTVSFAGSTVKAIRDAGFTATLSFVGNLVGIAVHFFTRAFTASLSFVGSLGTSRRFGRVLAASLSFSGALQRRITKVLAATLSFSTAVRRTIRKGFAAVQSFAVFFFKGGAITVLAGWITKCFATIGITGSIANVVRARSQLTVEKLDESGVQIQVTDSQLTVERTK